MESARAYDEEARRARAERILDAAASLLQRWGYRRFTMDDVANEAGIGKGTIYLHWRTREELFKAVLNREVAGLLGELRCAIERDPRNALPDRLGAIYFKIVVQRPLVRAVFSMDRDVLGKFYQLERAREPQLRLMRTEFLRFLQDIGALRRDISVEEASWAVRTLLVGFFLADPYFTEDQPDLDRKAELIRMLLQAALGTEIEPSEEVVAAIAGRVLELLNQASGAQLMAQLTQR